MARLMFYPIAKKNPLTKVVNYYPQKKTYSNISDVQLVSRIQANTGIPAAAVNAAISAITDSVINFVLNGHSVQVGDVMSIRPTVNSFGADSPAEVSAAQVRRLNFRVAWGVSLKDLQNPIHYEFENIQTKEVTLPPSAVSSAATGDSHSIIAKGNKKKKDL